PTTGKRDVDTLKFLSETYGHKDFGVYAEVVESGEIKTGDELELV
ncbi:MAG: molybdenum cofactor biosysynthesis protein, partial [Rhodobacteraceae bacterium]|nr:molybdenum cofactor biosysynthesis protein [Paracoccaceae bacterium]